MKTSVSYIFITLIFISINSKSISAQNSSCNIINISTNPPEPTVSDTVRFVVQTSFSSSGCPLDSFSLVQFENLFHLTTFYTLGFATAICYRTDTFTLGILPAGNYEVLLSTSSCYAPDNFDYCYENLSFTVSDILLQPQTELSQVRVIPNPCHDFLFIQFKDLIFISSLKIFNIFGKLQKSIQNSDTIVDISNLPSGMYFLEFKSQDSEIHKIRFIKQ